MSFPGPPDPSRVHRLLQPVWRAWVDLVYPRLCCACKVPVEEGWFCGSCAEALPLVEAPYCNVCGEVYEGAITQEFRCGNCSGRRLEFEFAVAACHAEGVMRELIHQFKYERRLHLRGALATLMLRVLEEPRLAGENLGGVAAGAGAAASQPGSGAGVQSELGAVHPAVAADGDPGGEGAGAHAGDGSAGGAEPGGAAEKPAGGVCAEA